MGADGQWCNFRGNPRHDGEIHVLASLDEASCAGGAMGEHPLAWCHPYDGGRAWYTGGGHTREAYSEPLFLEHLAGPRVWRVDAPFRATRWSGGSEPEWAHARARWNALTVQRASVAGFAATGR